MEEEEEEEVKRPSLSAQFIELQKNRARAIEYTETPRVAKRAKKILPNDAVGYLRFERTTLTEHHEKHPLYGEHEVGYVFRPLEAPGLNPNGSFTVKDRKDLDLELSFTFEDSREPLFEGFTLENFVEPQYRTEALYRAYAMVDDMLKVPKDLIFRNLRIAHLRRQ